MQSYRHTQIKCLKIKIAKWTNVEWPTVCCDIKIERRKQAQRLQTKSTLQHYHTQICKMDQLVLLT
jgi:hypothetical protein